MNASVTPVKEVQHQCTLHIIIPDYDWRKDNRKLPKPIISCKMMTKILRRDLRKNFPR